MRRKNVVQVQKIKVIETKRSFGESSPLERWLSNGEGAEPSAANPDLLAAPEEHEPSVLEERLNDVLNNKESIRRRLFTARQESVFALCLVKGLTLTETARRMGVSKNAVFETKEAVRKKLAKYLLQKGP